MTHGVAEMAPVHLGRQDQPGIEQEQQARAAGGRGRGAAEQQTDVADAAQGDGEEQRQRQRRAVPLGGGRSADHGAGDRVRPKTLASPRGENRVEGQRGGQDQHDVGLEHSRLAQVPGGDGEQGGRAQADPGTEQPPSDQEHDEQRGGAQQGLDDPGVPHGDPGEIRPSIRRDSDRGRQGGEPWQRARRLVHLEGRRVRQVGERRIVGAHRPPLAVGQDRGDVAGVVALVPEPVHRGVRPTEEHADGECPQEQQAEQPPLQAGRGGRDPFRLQVARRLCRVHRVNAGWGNRSRRSARGTVPAAARARAARCRRSDGRRRP